MSASVQPAALSEPRPIPAAPPPEPAPRATEDRLRAAIDRACELVPPLWPLRSFVAVDPYLSFEGSRFETAIGDVERIFHAPNLMPIEFYRSRFRSGRIQDRDLHRAIAETDDARAQGAGTVPALLERELHEAHFHDRGERILTFAESLDLATGSAFEAVVRDEIAKWCAGRFDAGQAAWSQPWKELSPYPAWREFARLDRSAEVRGIRGFRRYVDDLPVDPHQAIAAIVGQLDVPESDPEDRLARALASIGGWAGHVAYLAREGHFADAANSPLVDLLAIRLAFDGALRAAFGPMPASDVAPEAQGDGMHASSLAARHVWQVAYETAYQRELLARLRPGPASENQAPQRPDLQAVFCIDVRSEVLRRHLEALSPRIQTIGFAGFFGFPIEYIRIGDRLGGARCPVLIRPAHRIREQANEGTRVAEKISAAQDRHRVFKAMRLSTVTSFPLVETVGHFFGLRLITDSLGLTRPGSDGRLFESPNPAEVGPAIEESPETREAFGLPWEDRVQLAENALRNMGLVRDFAKVLLLCGHGSRSTNNPYASGLDCGACGGHRGDVNARVAAACLRDGAVRSALRERGIDIPDDTVVVAGMHDTTTDEIELFDGPDLPKEALSQVRSWLAAAGDHARRERLGRPGEPRGAAREALRRSRDWSEVRPEWGLARNAAFLAAPRDRTRGLDLEGRVFLHDYDHRRDADDAVLGLILSAPLVVASWINLQYYASTVAPEVFGSGTKVLHNVVGRLGVMAGNRSDLRVGLPLQSVHDGRDFVHEPLRLLAVIEAPCEKIERGLQRHEEVRRRVENGWIRLVALDPEDGSYHRFEDGRFVPVEDSTEEEPL